MKKFYILRRILYTLFIFAVVVTLCFFIPRMGVDDPCQRYYPPQGNMTDEQYEVIKELTRNSTASTARPGRSTEDTSETSLKATSERPIAREARRSWT